MKKINDDELHFVVKHYKENRLNADAAWIKLKLKTPSCLPKKSPKIMPNETSEKRAIGESPLRSTPALTKANNGRIKKATQ